MFWKFVNSGSLQISREGTCVRAFFKKVTGPRNCSFIEKGIIQEHLFRWGSMKGCFWNTSAPFQKHLIYRTSPVAVSDSFRFAASKFIKKGNPVKMFICEFCKIFKNIFWQKHLRMTPSCVYLWILKSFSDHLAFIEHLWETAYFI